MNSDKEKSGRLTGRVISIRPEGVDVLIGHRTLLCSIRGSVKQRQIKKKEQKNLICIGDFVYVTDHGTSGTVESIEKRKTVLSRADNLTRRKEHLIATNIDQVLITVSVVSPPLKPAVIDRYTIATLKGNMTPILVVNKMDLLKKNAAEEKLLNELLLIYKKAGVACYLVSSETEDGLDELKDAMKDKTSVFSGQSGVGKSSLINLLLGTDFATSDVVGRTNKGAHTTTRAHLVQMENGGFCIDTPGIKSFGVWELKEEDLSGYFTEISESATACKFRNCCHTIEVGCAVQLGIKNGTISPIRFQSYSALRSEIAEPDKKRTQNR